MRKPVVKAAIVGLGRWGRTLVESVQPTSKSGGSTIEFIRGVARNEDTRAFARSHNLAISATLEDALEDPSIDAVVLATPNDGHTAQILAASKARKHVFVEKPLTLDLSDAKTVAAAMQRAGLVLAVGFNRRFFPAMQFVKATVEGASFGTKVHIEGNFASNSGLKYYQSGMWRASEGGAKSAIANLGIHIIDTFIHLFGPIRSVRTTSAHQVLPVAVDNVVSATFTFENGASGYLSTCLTTPRHWRIQAFGTSKWVHMQNETLVTVADETDAITTETFAPIDTPRAELDIDTLRVELEKFAESISTGSPYPISLADAVHGVAVLEAIFESASNVGREIVVRC